MRHLPSKWAVAVLAILLATSTGAATEKSEAPIPRRNPIVNAVQKTQKSVVTIKVARSSGKDLVGTGVVIDERGLVVTNRHVVGANKYVKVRLADGSDLTGQVIVSEPSWDLAVVKIDPKGKINALPLAPSADLMVGETVIAVGHPFGYTNTVSVGIVSALEREITMPSGDTLTGLIQTDASINPGNSGGPLLNINGELIGINVALRDVAQGIAFAIGASTVKEVLSRHLSALRVAGINHGLKCEEKILGEVGDRQRVVLADVEGEQELASGDEIIAVAERQVVNSFDVERALWDKRPGETVTIQVVRQGKQMSVSLTLAAGNGAGAVAELHPMLQQSGQSATQRVQAASNQR